MTNEEKLEANMACAKLLEWKNYDVLNEGGCIILYHRQVKSGIEFDIFTNALQCLEVVKKLGEVHNIYMYPVDRKGWMAIDYCENPLTGIYGTIQEAAASAAIEVVK